MDRSSGGSETNETSAGKVVDVVMKTEGGIISNGDEIQPCRATKTKKGTGKRSDVWDYLSISIPGAVPSDRLA